MEAACSSCLANAPQTPCALFFSTIDRLTRASCRTYLFPSRVYSYCCCTILLYMLQTPRAPAVPTSTGLHHLAMLVLCVGRDKLHLPLPIHQVRRRQRSDNRTPTLTPVAWRQDAEHRRTAAFTTARRVGVPRPMNKRTGFGSTHTYLTVHSSDDLHSGRLCRPLLTVLAPLSLYINERATH